MEKLSLHERIGQYGIGVSARQFALYPIRSLCRIETSHAYVPREGFPRPRVNVNGINSLDGLNVSASVAKGEISVAYAEEIERLLRCGCRGVYATYEGVFAGSAWVQDKGEYRFPGGCMLIPDCWAVIRNIRVVRQCRNRGLGGQLNAAALALLPVDTQPVVFIVPYNNWAIRSWQKLQYVPILKVTKATVLGRAVWRSSTSLHPGPVCDSMREAIR